MNHTRIPQLLISLENILLEKHPLWAKGAMPGLTESVVRKYFLSEGISAKEELIQFFTWHNGVDFSIPELDVSMNGSFIDLEYAMEVYRYFIQQEFSWAAQMFPLSWDNNLLFSLNDGVIFLYAPSLLVVEPESIYDSMETMLISFITLLEQGIIRYSKNGESELDFNKRFEVSKQINPNSTYWKNDKIMD